MEWLGGLLLVAAGVALLWLLLIAILWVNRPTRDLAIPAARLLPDLARMVRRLMSDPATPRSSKLALGFLLLWIASPIDLIPEFIPIIGPLDDVVVAAIVLRWSGRRIGRDRLRESWTGSPEGWALLQRLL